jgi:small subunit ribosomal protein S1
MSKKIKLVIDAQEPKLIANEGFSDADLLELKKFLNEDGSEDSDSINAIKPGQLLKGMIVEITKDFVVVDVGLKSEGLIPIEEFDKKNDLNLNTEVEVFLERLEGDNGQIILSREKARKQQQWDFILSNCGEGAIVKAYVVRKVKGGLMVSIGGMDAFLPGSQIDNKRIKNLDDLVGQTFEVKILKINTERKNIVVSRRELIEEERVSKKAELLENIQVNDVCKGVVKNITDFGVFLDLDGIDGLLHITDMTWKRIKHPSELVSIGDEIEVVILNIDKEKGRVALGLKQKETNPWDEIEGKYPPGTKVKGKIVNLVNYGAFIEIESGIEGLIHVSEMSWVKNITDPTEVVNKGDEVEAIVLSIQKNEGKISLGIKQLDRNPWETIESKYPVSSVVTVEIRSLTNYGAFVEIEPGIDGLIHISDLSWTKKISHPSEVLQIGQDVEAIILSIDAESKKITLGIKELTENPWDSIIKTFPIGNNVKGVVKKVTAFGAFIELNNGIEGLVHVSELSDQSFARVEDVVAVGAEVEAVVIKIDQEHKRISLSIKDFMVEKNQVNRDDIVLGSTEEE